MRRRAALTRYVAVSPSLWYDNHLIFRIEDELAKTRPRIDARVYMVSDHAR